MSDDNLTDDQVNAFFENGGNAEAAGIAEQEPEAPEVEAQSEPEQQDQQHGEQEGAKDAQGEPQQEQGESYEVGQSDPPDVELKRLKAALGENRQRFKQTRDENEQLRQQVEQMQHYLRQQQQQQQQRQQQSQQPEYDPDDPIAVLTHQNNQLSERIKQFETFQQQNMRQTQQQQAEQQVADWMIAKGREYKAVQPDIADAWKYFEDKKRAEFAAFGHSGSNIDKLMHDTSLAIGAQAMQIGTNPAEIVYSLAKTYGYDGPVHKRNEQDVKTQQAKQQFDALEKGLKQSKSLSQGGGENPEPTLEEKLQNIDKLSPNELDKIWDQMQKENGMGFNL